MIRNEELAQVKARAHKVETGEYLTSDAVANHVAELLDGIEQFPYRPDNWSTAMELAPREASIVEGWYDELTYLTEQIEAHQTGTGSPTVINPAVTVEVE